MTCGIYMLSWFDTHKVYIGQSEVAVESRLTDHLRNLRNKTHSIKMNAAYVEFGVPSFEILEECTPKKLDERENYHINLWNAVDDGFNTLRTAQDSPTCTHVGEDHGMSKFSNIQITEVFNILVDSPQFSHKHIEKLTGIPSGTIAMLACGKTHKWLEQVYPEKYRVLLSIKNTYTGIHNTAKSRGIVYPIIISPEGIPYSIENALAFSKLHSLNNSHLGEVLLGKRKTHKGWRLASNVN